jgi:polyisoprenyl-teichoic acid--peptidoglycan teichoic acid transferase
MSLIPRSRGGALWRFALASVVMVVSVAGATAVAGLLQFDQVVKDLNLTKAFKGLSLQLPPAGAPQTLLLIGSDHRAGEAFSAANTDTMMLVRLNASSSTINVLSIPRDLRVQLPVGGGQTAGYKLNAAYSFGGPKLLINTLKTQVFPGLQINHVLDVNFGGFEKLVDAIGCVYGDVDHRYYNNTAYTDYSSIDIQPGYQKLCNTNALAFVRFRHTDSDIVRNARQQDFIRWAKDQYGVGQLLSNRDKLLRIFGEHVQTDPGLHSLDQVIELFDLVVGSDGHTIKQIPFPYVLGPCGGSAQTPCYVFAQSARAEQSAYTTFMTPTIAPSSQGQGGAGAHHHHHRHSGPPQGLTADVADGRSQAAQLAHVGMPVYFPKVILANSNYCFSITGNCDESFPNSEYDHSYPRAYLLRSQDGRPHAAYRMTLVINPLLGLYYGIQGTTWQNPPILNHPTQEQTIHGKTLLEYFNGGKLGLVAWRTPHGVYWISNTLNSAIGNSQLKAIAASLTRYNG